MRLICCSLLIVAAGPVFCFAQQRDISYDLWLTRSQTITSELIKDSTDLTQSERAELWARLAQKWWRDDPERAHSWLLRSIEIVEPVPNKEKVDERRERLNSANLLFKIAAPLDKKLSERLLAILTQDAAQEAIEERTTDTERLMEVASFLAEKDPQRAAELGALALQLGNPTQIELLILKLRRKDVKLSNALFAQTLAAARKTLNRGLLYSLTQVAFSETLQPAANMIAVPDQLRIELLKLDLTYLQANQINSQNRNSICISIRAFIAPVLAEFDRLLPQQAVIARQSLSQCQSINPLVRQGVDGALRDQPLNTVDSLLKAASDAQDQKVRAVYEFRAALLARQENDFDQALRILDNMSAQSREFAGGSWESYRWEWAALSALNHLKNRDVYGMRIILNAVPTQLQPFAKIAFVRQLPDKRDNDTDPTLELLNDARAGLSRSALSDAERADGYLALLPLAIRFQPKEAIVVLKEAITALNRTEQAKRKTTPNTEDNSLSGAEFVKNLPASLLDMDEYAVNEAVASITSLNIRVQVRLELLRVCLMRLRSGKDVSSQ